MAADLRLLSVHAHPDDEASKGAPSVAKYVAEGAEAVLVCCTGGEEGDIHNKSLLEEGGAFHGLDEAGIKAKMAELRPDELARSVEIIGFTECVMLGYRDSGMKDTAPNDHPDCFWQADLDEATGRLVAHSSHPPTRAVDLPRRSAGLPAPRSSASTRHHVAGMGPSG